MNAARVDTPTQRALAWLYERYGPRVLYVCVAGTGAIGVVLIGLAALWGLTFVRPTPYEALVGAVMTALAALPAVVGVFWLVRAETRPILEWVADDRASARAPAVWNALVRLPFTFPRRIVILLLPLGIVSSALTVLIIDKPASVGLQLWVIGVVAVMSAFYPTMFALELVVRPLLKEVAPHLPADFEPAVPVVALRSRTIAPVLSVSLLTAMTAAAADHLVNTDEARQALVTVVGVVVFAMAALFFRAVSPSTLEPIEELVAGSRRVAAGDLSQPVPLLVGDDLGRLTLSFNRMVVDLRERSAELEASRARVVAAGDAERRRVERDLHDGAQQHLVLLRLKLTQAQSWGEITPERAADLRAELDLALAEVRDLAHGIYPTVLETDGLPAALTEAAARAAIPTKVDVNGTVRQSRDVETAVYFCCREALQNAAKHAGGAARATVTLTAEADCLRFVVADDGHGFDPALVQSSGLQNLADRIGALGGRLEIETAPGRGVTIRGEVPTT